MSNKTIKISEKNYNKLHEIKNLQGLKSIDQVINQILPQGTTTNSDFEMEPPAFMIGEELITWTQLKNTETETEWKTNDETAKIIFKDKYGALIRFNICNDVFLNYFHFI